MAHPVADVLALEPLPDGTVHARLKLACGCRFEGVIAADRVLQTDRGTPLVVGKYRCSEGHPPKAPPG